MSKEFSQFPFRNTIGPIEATDRFLVGIPDPASPTGFSNYLVTSAQLAAALGINFSVEFIIGDGSNLIVAGTKPTAVVVMPRAGVFTGWTILSADPGPIVGSVVVDIWKSTYAGYPPIAAGSITGAAKPNIVTDIKNESILLPGWITAFAAGDILVPNIDSVVGLKAVKLVMNYRII